MRAQAVALSRNAQRILVVAVIGLGLVALPAAPALANPACGSTITANLTLTGDLNCTGNALIIGANGLTVDLAGFNIIGTGTGIGVRSINFDDLTVTNGGISGFATGISASSGARATLTGLTVSNGVGIQLQNEEDDVVSASTFASTQIKLNHALRTVITGITGDHTLVSLLDSNNSSLTSSSLTDGPVTVSQSNSVSITDSTFLRAPIALGATSRTNLIQNNTIQGAVNGVEVDNTSRGARILGNQFIGNKVGARVAGDVTGVAGPTISTNTFTGNTAAGLLFQATTTGGPATVSGNVFDSNGLLGGVNDRLGRPVADGAHFATVVGSSITVASNITLNNASYGIFADAGSVIDGGGNDSTGDPSGCAGVACI